MKLRLGKIAISSIAVLLIVCPTFSRAAEILDLAGEWGFALDRENSGVTNNWFDQSFQNKILLPGALQAQNFGDEISTKTPWVLSLYDRFWYERKEYKAYTKDGHVKVPFLSQPPRHYVGAAWYQRTVEIPEAWRGKRIVLFLERPHWETTVWLDGKRINSNRSLVAPHVYDFGIIESGTRRLTIRIDNSLVMPYRPDAHGVSDSLAGSWNGIVGKIELRATSPVWIDDVQVTTRRRGDAETRRGSNRANSWTATVKAKIGNSIGHVGSGTLSANGKTFPVSWDAGGGLTEIELSFPNAQLWDEFHPVLQRLSLSLKGANADDLREISFGLRDFRAEGNRFVLNGRPIYFRGTHHGGDFPLTGYPPTDVEYWRKIFQINKNWGINHIRFHSFCPPEAAFQAADELGIYLQPEPGMWNEISPGTAMEKMLYEETDAMIKAYGNHPSFLLLSPSNEPKGRWKESLGKWIEHYRKADPRRLYTNGTGHTEREVPGLAEGTDYLAMQRIGPKMLRGNSAWFGKDYGKSLEGINIPVVSHELGQWVAYPDFEIIKKFTGYMRPGNYEIFRDSAAAHGVLAKNKGFAYSSGRFQLACYKEEIEANLRTPGLSGFQLLDLHDYLGQGTALVGLLDAFWEEKDYVTAKEFRRFNNTTVPLTRLTKRTFTVGDKFEVETEIAHFGEKPIESAKAFWKIVDAGGRPIAEGEFPTVTIPIGKNFPLGKISIDLSDPNKRGRERGPEFLSPAAYKLVVGIRGTEFENDWNFWVYPSSTMPKPPRSKRENVRSGNTDENVSRQILITHSWDDAEAKLKTGGKVLYIPRKADLDWTSPPLDTIPVFWNRLMNPAWGRMLGLWIDKKHGALAGFPTDSFFDWQWTEIVRNTRAINLDKLPKTLQPIVQPIDDWNRNDKLGLIFECKIGRGKLLVSAADLERDLDSRIVALTIRKSILNYMASAKFNPQVEVGPENFREIFFDTRIMKKLGAVATAPGEAANAIDGDPNTFWLAGNQREAARQNQELTITFLKAIEFSGLVLMPRQNHREHEGDIREYSIQISNDGTNWREIKSGELASTFNPQKIEFGQMFSAKFLKLVSLSGFGIDKTTALAELAVIYAGPKLFEGAEDLEYKRSKSATPDIDEGNIENNIENKKPKKP